MEETLLKENVDLKKRIAELEEEVRQSKEMLEKFKESSRKQVFA